MIIRLNCKIRDTGVYKRILYPVFKNPYRFCFDLFVGWQWFIVETKPHDFHEFYTVEHIQHRWYQEKKNPVVVKLRFNIELLLIQDSDILKF